MLAGDSTERACSLLLDGVVDTAFVEDTHGKSTPHLAVTLNLLPRACPPMQKQTCANHEGCVKLRHLGSIVEFGVTHLRCNHRGRTAQMLQARGVCVAGRCAGAGAGAGGARGMAPAAHRPGAS